MVQLEGVILFGAKTLKWEEEEDSDRPFDGKCYRNFKVSGSTPVRRGLARKEAEVGIGNSKRDDDSKGDSRLSFVLDPAEMQKPKDLGRPENANSH